MTNEKENNKEEKKENSVSGVVIEALPNTLFKIKIADGQELLAYLSGKMRMNRIRVMVGDKVEILLDEYGGRARIFKRL